MRIFITAQEIIVDNASYPIKEIAENSHIFRTLGLGYANLGSLIMSYGLRLRHRRRPRARAARSPSIMTGDAYEQSARDGASAWGRSPAIDDARCSGVSKAGRERQCRVDARSHRAASRRASNEIQPSDEFAYLKEEAREVWDSAARAGQEARLPQRAGHRPRADRHDRFPDGLRHDRHRARHRAGEIQAARRRRHAEDRQPDRASRRCKTSATTPRRSNGSSRTSTSTTRSRTLPMPTASTISSAA